MREARFSRPPANPRPALPREKGFALVSVLVVITLLVAATVALSRANRTELQEAANLADGVKLYYMAKSGYNGAEALLSLDKNNYDALTEEWANAEELAAKASILFGTGSLTVTIEDETGKIPLHRLYLHEEKKVSEPIREMLIRLFKRPEFKLESRQVGEIVAALIDWLDPDEETGPGGAESAYYRTLASPYEAKNGPLDGLEELLMVKGVGRELFYGTKETPGLKKFLTVWGEGKININTAPREVLAVFREGVTEKMLDSLDDFRRDKKNDLSSANWYKAIVGEGFDPHGLITVKSSSFTIIATARRERMSKTVEAVVSRQGEKLRLVSWKVD